MKGIGGISASGALRTPDAGRRRAHTPGDSKPMMMRWFAILAAVFLSVAALPAARSLADEAPSPGTSTDQETAYDLGTILVREAKIRQARDDPASYTTVILPEQFATTVKEAVIEGCGGGVLMGYPVMDIAVTLFEAQYKEDVSTEPDFRVAASQAFREGLRQAGPALLEPMMSVEIIVPDEFTGEVISDLNIRWGKVENIAARKTIKIITAIVPLSAMFGYSTALRSATQGRGTFTMQFSHYGLVERKKR